MANGNGNGRKAATWVSVTIAALVLIGSLISAWVSVQSSLADTYSKGEVNDIARPIRSDMVQVKERQARMEKSIEYILKGQEKMDRKIDRLLRRGR